MDIYLSNKVLLRERKRHTAYRVLSTPSSVLSQRGGEGTPSLARIPPARPDWGTPPVWTWLGYPLSRPGWCTPIWSWPGYPPVLTWPGYPPPPQGVNWQTNWKYYLPRPSDADANKFPKTNIVKFQWESSVYLEMFKYFQNFPRDATTVITIN